MEGTIETSREVKRVIGRVEGDRRGPTLLVTGGIHGNEWAGVEALERFLEELRPYRERLSGRVMAIAGNLQALRRRVRYVEKDLNRQWTPEITRKILSSALDGTRVPEHREQIELLDLVNRTLDEVSDGEVYFIDLHTSSAEGGPFVTVGDTLRNRAFAERFSLPMILGLEEQVDGSLLEYVNNRGYVTMGVEGGGHDAPSSVDRIEAVLWLAVAAARMLDPATVPPVARSRELLDEATRGMPGILGVRYRHAIRPDDDYRMEPGYTNFSPVEAGAVLGRDRRGEVRARENGLILLPLYQGKGDDGFFLAREVRPAWLELSRLLRRLRLNLLARFLPGIRRHPDRDGTLVVDKRIARYYPLDVMHLLGYRKLREQGNVLLVSRRRFDLRPPPSVTRG